jgi:hypothetical protein
MLELHHVFMWCRVRAVMQPEWGHWTEVKGMPWGGECVRQVALCKATIDTRISL